jgi:glycosyltransferase involved in cell wall biosynthesis
MSLSDVASRRRALFIAYTFPPVGGAGVQRTTKFVKYLPQFGWDTSVLTVSNPSVPVRDDSLCRDVPTATNVVRARTFEPSYAVKATLADRSVRSGAGKIAKGAVRRALTSLLQPDPQVLWTAPAFCAAIRAVRDLRHDVIVASAPPFSSLLLGAALSSYTKLPLVLDYRDEWDVSHRCWENRQARGMSLALQRSMERSALRHADMVIATSPRSAATLGALCHDARSRARVTHIFNGFDPDDFASPVAARWRTSNAFWRLVYTGTLYNLSTPEPLVRAIEALAAVDPALAAKIELVFAGRRAPEQDQRLARLAGLCRLQTRDYVSHADAIVLMRTADALCVLVSDLPGAGRVVPAKVFEYMASDKPILAIAPHGEVWDILGSHPAAFTCTPGDASGLRDWLADAVQGGARPVEPGSVDTSPYDRRRQAQRLASLLEEVVAGRPVSYSLVKRVECFG